MSQATPASTMPATAIAQPPRRRFDRDRIISLLIIAPSILAVAVFVYFFILQTGYYSLINWNNYTFSNNFVGFNNYSNLFDTTRFQTDLRNTLYFTVAFIGVCLGLGLFLATMLDQKIKAEGIFRNIFMFPLAISFVVTGVAWRWMLDPGTATERGGINALFGLDWGWYTDPNIGILSVALAAIWQMSGYVMAMYLAGLRAIPEEIREAARVDGATELQVFRHIILPMLQPVTLSAVIILGHISLKTFDLVKTMTGSGAAFATDLPALNMYETIGASDTSTGASIAIIILLLVSVLIIPYLIYNFKTEVRQ